MSTPQIGPAPAPEPDDRMTASEFLDSLTGFDELAIAKAFGKPIEDMGGGVSMGGRALVFVVKRRDGMKDAAAYEYAMNLPGSKIDDHFRPGDDEKLPGSETGKGDG
jgi:hypothetical protein